MTDSPWLTIEEAARYVKWSEGKMRVLVEGKKIPHAKAGRHVRIHVADLDHYLRSRIIAVTNEDQTSPYGTKVLNVTAENAPLTDKTV